MSEAQAERGSYLQRTPYVFPGYAIQGFQCAACGHVWNAIALVGTVGVECPQCGLAEEAFVWRSQEPDYAHDGAWLTAHWDLPMYSGTRGMDASASVADMVEVSEEGLPWWKRALLRLQVCWWVIRGEY